MLPYVEYILEVSGTNILNQTGSRSQLEFKSIDTHGMRSPPKLQIMARPSFAIGTEAVFETTLYPTCGEPADDFYDDLQVINWRLILITGHYEHCFSSIAWLIYKQMNSTTCIVYSVFKLRDTTKKFRLMILCWNGILGNQKEHQNTHFQISFNVLTILVRAYTIHFTFFKWHTAHARIKRVKKI